MGKTMDHDYAVETHHLTKRYGNRTVVDGLDLRVRRGEVYGFVGPNGAGKTTTLRMLVGLVRPSAGEAMVLGAPPGSPAGLTRVGALIEAPAFYPFLSGWDNLGVVARHAGVSPTRIAPALQDVGLETRGGDRFATYSLGMKQRLAVAAALLKDPVLLLLDEPMNGLDPAGQGEMRALMRGLARNGRAVLLSSHLMAEVERDCDRVGVIRSGQLVAEGTVNELRGEDRLRVRAEPLEEARRVVEILPGIGRVLVVDDHLEVSAAAAAAPTIARAVVGAGLALAELRPEHGSFEEAFLALTRTTEDA
jgi:ABC-2 type transport system ATP-binding protein